MGFLSVNHVFPLKIFTSGMKDGKLSVESDETNFQNEENWMNKTSQNSLHLIRYKISLWLTFSIFCFRTWCRLNSN